ncbi:alpha/beta hydrolase [Streptomyces griseus]|uniref:alpha/beta hydrolase n=1 Tax=Streptomyces griseus TaxID=1911 RepID=UPI0004C77226|nr:alpha/beta hydrolase [Streptomyces griseus]
MDLATLKAFKPSEYEEAADGYRATGDMASEAKDAIDNRIGLGLRGEVKGDAAEAAHEQLKKLSSNFHYVQTECGLVSTALNGFAFDIAVAKRKLEAAMEDARADGCTVNANGSVSYPAGKKPGDEKTAEGGAVTGSAGGTPVSDAVERQAVHFHPNPHYGKALAYANRIADALEEATDADTKWAPKLRALKADDDLEVSHRDWADVKADTGGVSEAGRNYFDSLPEPPKDGTPRDNAAWWKGLSPEEQAAHLALNAARVGALDGLPAETRDEANRKIFAEKRSEFELALRAIPPAPPKYTYVNSDRGPIRTYSGEYMEWIDKYSDRKKELEGHLKGMDQIQDRFDRTGVRGLPEAYLLGYDPVGHSDGKIILANGNPDTADHTAVYVPGTKANIEKIAEGADLGDLGRSEVLWAESVQMSPRESYSTITWLDYDAPDKIGGEATRGSYAEDAGPTLRSFMEGNRAAHEAHSGSPGHTTLIGHSYGTTVVGVAAQSDIGPVGDFGPTPRIADDVIAVGSPGMQADHAADLGIGAKNVWAMGGPYDDQVVRQGGRLVGLGDSLTIPTDERFGGNIMKSDSSDHGGFWDRESTSLRNQAAVIAGKYEQVQHD